jgi:hypothetical protein
MHPSSHFQTLISHGDFPLFPPHFAYARAHQIKACMMAMQNNCFQLLGAIKVGGTAAAMCTNIVACVGTTKMTKTTVLFSIHATHSANLNI